MFVGPWFIGWLVRLGVHYACRDFPKSKSPFFVDRYSASVPNFTIVFKGHGQVQGHKHRTENLPFVIAEKWVDIFTKFGSLTEVILS